MAGFSAIPGLKFFSCYDHDSTTKIENPDRIAVDLELPSSKASSDFNPHDSVDSPPGLEFDQLSNGKYAVTHIQSGIRLARSFSQEEIEKLRGWEPPDVSPPTTKAFASLQAALLRRSAENFLEVAADTDRDACPNCGSLKLDRLPAPRPHHTKLECTECGRFLRWLPSPRSIANREKLRKRIEKLLPSAKDWDLDFLKSIAHHLDSGKSLSPKQLAQVERIASEQGGAA